MRSDRLRRLICSKEARLRPLPTDSPNLLIIELHTNACLPDDNEPMEIPCDYDDWSGVCVHRYLASFRTFSHNSPDCRTRVGAHRWINRSWWTHRQDNASVPTGVAG